MALNLNKGGEENSKPPSEKKGFNLSKSVDSVKTGLSLSKEEVVSKETTSSKFASNEPDPPKKNPVIFILIAVFLVGGGLFWFLNRRTINPEYSTNLKGDNAVSSLPVQIEDSASLNKTGNQVQDNSVKPSTITSSDNSKAIPPKNDVSVSSNNITESSNIEISNSTPSNNQSARSTLTPSAVTPVGSIDEKVNQVLRGDFGNGLDRRKALGADYAEIQAKVNEILKYKN